jgi:hypothetical protein
LLTSWLEEGDSSGALITTLLKSASHPRRQWSLIYFSIPTDYVEGNKRLHLTCSSYFKGAVATLRSILWHSACKKSFSKLLSRWLRLGMHSKTWLLQNHEPLNIFPYEKGFWLTWIIPPRQKESSTVFYYLFKLQMGFYPVAVYYNKTKHTNNTHHIQANTAHKTTQNIKDTLHTINAMQMSTCPIYNFYVHMCSDSYQNHQPRNSFTPHNYWIVRSFVSFSFWFSPLTFF